MVAASEWTTLLQIGLTPQLRVNTWVIVAVVVATRTAAVMTATTIIATRTVIAATVTATATLTPAGTTETTETETMEGRGIGIGVTAAVLPLAAVIRLITEGAGATPEALLVAVAQHVLGITMAHPQCLQLASPVGEG